MVGVCLTWINAQPMIINRIHNFFFNIYSIEPVGYTGTNIYIIITSIIMVVSLWYVHCHYLEFWTGPIHILLVSGSSLRGIALPKCYHQLTALWIHKNEIAISYFFTSECEFRTYFYPVARFTLMLGIWSRPIVSNNFNLPDVLGEDSQSDTPFTVWLLFYFL